MRRTGSPHTRKAEHGSKAVHGGREPRRLGTGKMANRALRKQKKVPAVVYGGEADPENVTLEYKAVWQNYQTGHFLSTVYLLDVDGKQERVIPRDVQVDPVRDFPIHVDFMRVSKSSQIDVAVPVHFVNEEASPGLKRGGVLNIVRHEIELSCPAEFDPREPYHRSHRPRNRR